MPSALKAAVCFSPPSIAPLLRNNEFIHPTRHAFEAGAVFLGRVAESLKLHGVETEPRGRVMNLFALVNDLLHCSNEAAYRNCLRKYTIKLGVSFWP